jgi:hypothetical protein
VLVEDDGFAGETSDEVRRERRVRGEELLHEGLVVRPAPEDEELEIGEGVGEFDVGLVVHTRRIGRDEPRL